MATVRKTHDFESVVLLRRRQLAGLVPDMAIAPFRVAMTTATAIAAKFGGAK
jgi:hypothetical protein